jgi:hypothetical protein
MAGDSSRIIPEGQGPQSSSHHGETRQQRWDRNTRFTGGNRESPGEAHYRRMQNTATELGIRIPDQRTEGWRVFSINLLERKLAEASNPYNPRTFNPYAQEYLNTYLNDRNQAMSYLRNHAHEIDKFGQAVILTDILEGGASIPPELIIRDSEEYRERMEFVFKEWDNENEVMNNTHIMNYGPREKTEMEKRRARIDQEHYTRYGTTYDEIRRHFP